MTDVRLALEDAQQDRFPPVCVRTGEDATTTIKVDAFYTPTWAYALYLIGVFPGAVVVSLIRNRYPQARGMQIPVTDRIAMMRRDRTALAVVATFGGLVLIVVGGVTDTNPAVAAGLFLSLAALALTFLAMNVPGITARVTPEGDVELKHVHDRFAAALHARDAARP